MDERDDGVVRGGAVPDDSSPANGPLAPLPPPPPPFVGPLPPPPPPRAVDPLADPGLRAWHEIVTSQAAGRPLAAPRPRRRPWRTVVLTLAAVAAAVAVVAVAVVEAGGLLMLG